LLVIVIPEPAGGVNLNFFFAAEQGAYWGTIFEYLAQPSKPTKPLS
jgi:hypothetical protein